MDKMNPLPTYFPPDFPAPRTPQIGRGVVWQRFPFPHRSPEAKAFWAAIPAAHKIHRSRKRWISPEVYARLIESQKKFWACIPSRKR